MPVVNCIHRSGYLFGRRRRFVAALKRAVSESFTKWDTKPVTQDDVYITFSKEQSGGGVRNHMVIMISVKETANRLSHAEGIVKDIREKIRPIMRGKVYSIHLLPVMIAGCNSRTN
ncbi:MAG: hypothetical protein PHP35_00510 [Candidatus Colwellbacteria bacterium]|nr:hypothetical protein [Candidatus Colwellbacteria bacterium]